MISEKPEKFDGFGVSSGFVGESVGESVDESVDLMVRKWVIMVPGIFRVVGVGKSCIRMMTGQQEDAEFNDTDSSLSSYP